ncbi:MAG: mannitol dehydrogenase family protein [Leptolyngbya sp. SIO1D8]|nr:mannitol dehydrogenase family protein [Leptolyngbya sp. SIO1D8]
MNDSQPLFHPTSHLKSNRPTSSHQPTKTPIPLNEASLSQQWEQVRLPQYDRKAVINGIVHIGVGGFHRAHQALYLDNYLEYAIAQTSTSEPLSQWGICGVGLLQHDQKMRDILQAQDGLYTLIERSPEQDTARIIGAITQYLFAPDDPQAVIDAIAHPHCRIVTLTITEGGYYVVEGTGEFDADHPTIQHDLQHPNQPIGVYGFLTAALKRRRQNGLPPFTVLSCDNIQGNGNVVGKMLTAFATLQNPELGQWIAKNITFPNSMVDRITPATTLDDIQTVRDQFGIQDGWPVVAEPFIQWVVEDNFCAGRPNWESVGVQMTDDVHPYERMKIRLLNASHLLIGYLGSLLGYTYTSEAMANVLIRAATVCLMDEVISTLQPLPGIDITAYQHTLIERFSNPKVRDQLARLCLNSSDKLPKFLLGSLRDKLEQGGSIKYLSFTIAAWFRYLNGQDERGRMLLIDDPMADVLTKQAQFGGSDPTPLLSLTTLFGDLPKSAEFTDAVANHLQQLYTLGTEEALTELLSKSS